MMFLWFGRARDIKETAFMRAVREIKPLTREQEIKAFGLLCEHVGIEPTPEQLKRVAGGGIEPPTSPL